MTLKSLFKFCFVVLLVGPTFVSAQREAVLDKPFDEKTAIAKYIYSLVQYTKWPVDLDTTKICIVGDQDVSELLKNVNDTPEFMNSIIILDEVEEYDSCNVIYISSKSKIKKILTATKGYPVLTISDVRGFAKKGGLVSFPYKNGKITMKANLRSIKRSGLVIDAELLSLMDIIN